MPDLHSQYERQLQQVIAQALTQLQKYYEKSLLEISITAASLRLKSQLFSLSLYPVLNARIEKLIDGLHADLYKSILKSIEESWSLSNLKNDQLVDRRLAGRSPVPEARQILYDPNKDAYDKFISRKERGLNLSGRIWNGLEPFAHELEQGLGLGISNGQSAAKLAKELKRNLHDPDRLFRRVRGEDGKLRLSKKARAYQPGQGIYRSSYKNSLRLTRTENNMAYRTADHERWQALPFVKGIVIKTSDNHPHYDICDRLKGKYPKDFLFRGWHPQCICYQVPSMVSDGQYEKIEDALLAGDMMPHFEGAIGPPAAFHKYLEENADRIAKWKNKPYWLKDNSSYL